MKPRSSRVPPEGEKTSLIALVGEQPGRTEVRRRKPFCGPSGNVLDSCLSSAGIPRYSCYLTNVFKDLDYPLEHYVTSKRSEPVYSSDGLEYLEELKEELSSLSANVVVAIGGVALGALTNRLGITKWRGSVIESTLVPGKKIIPCFHPSTVLPPKNVFLNKRLIIYDLLRAKEQSQFPEIRLTPRHVKLQPPYFDCLSFLNDMISEGKAGKIIFFDIEVVKGEISCISFSSNPREAISIPFVYHEGDYFTIEQEIKIWRKIAELLEDPLIAKGGQNLTFDCSMLLSKMGIRVRNIAVDTMVNQKIILPDYPAGLDFITSLYSDISYYKSEGKKWLKMGGSYKDFWQYNGLDSIACSAVAPKQVEEILSQNNLETVQRQTKIIEPLIYMSQRGIKVDIEGMKEHRDKIHEKIETLSEQLRFKIGSFSKLPSPQQLSQYFYITLGHKPYLKKGKITTDDTALARLIRKGVKEAEQVRELRGLRKVFSTYVNLDKISPDGRLRCSYNPAGTKTGRISSSEDIFGYGVNLMNWPHDLLKYLVADDGYVLYSIDLSQAENRIVAYVGRVPRLMQAFENNEDVHSLTGALISGKTYDEVRKEDKEDIRAPIGRGRHTWRFWGKKSNHSLNYDEGYRKFSLICEIPENEGKWIVDKFHYIYPEIRGVYYQNIRLQLSKNRTLTNLMGRKRVFTEDWGDTMFRKAYAHIPQSTVADVIDERGLNYVYYNQQLFSSLELLMQVHDSISFQLPLSLSWAEHARTILLIKKMLETPLRVNETSFVIPVDILMGLNFCKEESRELKHPPNSLTELALLLEKNYQELSNKKKGENK